MVAADLREGEAYARGTASDERRCAGAEDRGHCLLDAVVVASIVLEGVVRMAVVQEVGSVLGK